MVDRSNLHELGTCQGLVLARKGASAGKVYRTPEALQRQLNVMEAVCAGLMANMTGWTSGCN